MKRRDVLKSGILAGIWALFGLGKSTPLPNPEPELDDDEIEWDEYWEYGYDLEEGDNVQYVNVGFQPDAVLIWDVKSFDKDGFTLELPAGESYKVGYIQS